MSEQTKHTPGPWSIAGGYHLLGSDRTEIATLCKGDDFEAEQESNCHLLRASPDLLNENEAAVGSLRSIERELENIDTDDSVEIARRIRLICNDLENVARKARGESC